jgi:hypothetical protein
MTISIVFTLRFLCIWTSGFFVYFWNIKIFMMFVFTVSSVWQASLQRDANYYECLKLQYNRNRTLFLNYELPLENNLSYKSQFHMSKAGHHVSGLPRSHVDCFMPTAFKTLKYNKNGSVCRHFKIDCLGRNTGMGCFTCRAL